MVLREREIGRIQNGACDGPASGPVERMIGDSVLAKDWSADVLQTAGQISPEVGLC